MSHPAHAIQAALDHQAERDRLRQENYRGECGVLTCERAKFLGDRYTVAQDEADHLRRHMRLKGITVPPVRDGHQADHAWLAPGRPA